MKNALIIGAVFYSVICIAQQVPDTTFKYNIAHIKYPNKNGPTVYIDAAHHNFHTKQGGFFGFCKLLEQDGFCFAG